MSNSLFCAHCSYTTSRLYNLKRHINSKHSDVLNQKTHLAENVNMLAENVNMPAENVNIPAENVNMPAENVNIYKCPTCYKEFTRKWSLHKHLPLCKCLSSSLQCEKCNKILSSLPSKSRHMKTCTGKPTHADAIVTSNATPIQQNITNNSNLINNGNISNVTINICAYGKENMAHVTDAFKDARLQELNGNGIVKMIESIHFNPNIPENHNIRKHNKEFWKVYNNGDWKFKSFQNAILDLIERYRRDLAQRAYDPEFKNKIKCELTLQEIMLNFSKFDKDRSPSNFYARVRDILGLMENLEHQYQRVPTLIQYKDMP